MQAKVIGDPLPAALGVYYDAIDSGRMDDAVAAFAAGVVYAVPRAGAEETEPRVVRQGREALLALFRERGRKPWRHVVKLCVIEGKEFMLEGVVADDSGTETATFIASGRLAADGVIERYLVFSSRGTLAIPVDLDPGVVPNDAPRLIDAYFHALDDGRFADAAACFSEDVVYSHPPYKHSGISDPDRVVFRGRAALEAGFNQRGVIELGHEIYVMVQRGPHCMFEGAVTGLPNGGAASFVSSMSLAADGTIRRYLSYYTDPALPFR